MRHLLYPIFFATILCACTRKKQSGATVTPEQPTEKPSAINKNNNDTLTLSSRCAVQFVHDTAQLEKLKQQMGDDFYTVADDAGFYNAEAMEFLDSVKMPVHYIKEVKYLAFENNYKVAQIVKTDTLTLFNLFLFDPRNVSPKLVDITNIEQAYEEFISTKR